MAAQGESRGSIGREASVFHSEEIAEIFIAISSIRRQLDDVARLASKLSRREMTARAVLGEQERSKPEDLFRGTV